MFAEHLCRQTDSLVRHESAVRVHVQRQLIVVRNLTYTGILHGNIDSLHRCIDGINRDHPNRQIISLILISAHIAPTSCNSQLHVKLCILTAQGSNHQIGIQNLDILIYLDIGSPHNTLALVLNVSGFHLVRIAVILDGKALNVHNDLRHVFLHAGNRTKLMEDTLDLNLTYRHSWQGRQHNPSK